jgi:hypothetical protein
LYLVLFLPLLLVSHNSAVIVSWPAIRLGVKEKRTRKTIRKVMSNVKMDKGNGKLAKGVFKKKKNKDIAQHNLFSLP